MSQSFPTRQSKRPAELTPAPRPKLMFFGDPHGDFRFVIDAVNRHAPQAIVLLGDIQSRSVSSDRPFMFALFRR